MFDTSFNLVTSIKNGIDSGDVLLSSLEGYGRRIYKLASQIEKDQKEKTPRKEADLSILLGHKVRIESLSKKGKPFAVKIPIVVLYEKRTNLSRFIDAKLNAEYLGPYDLYGDSSIVLHDQSILFTPASEGDTIKKMTNAEPVSRKPTDYGIATWYMPINNSEALHRAIAPNGVWPDWGLLIGKK